MTNNLAIKVNNLVGWLDKARDVDVDTLLKAYAKAIVLLNDLQSVLADYIAEGDTLHYTRKVEELKAINKYRAMKLRVDEAKIKAHEDIEEKITNEVSVNRDINLLKGYINTVEKAIGYINNLIRLNKNDKDRWRVDTNSQRAIVRRVVRDTQGDGEGVQAKAWGANKEEAVLRNKDTEAKEASQEVLRRGGSEGSIIEGRELDKSFEEIFN